MACNSVFAAAAVLVLLHCIPASAQRLTGNLTGSGATCIPDVAFSAGTGLGQGCADGEACCTTTNTCVKRSSCSEFMRICPPPSCGKDTNFQDAECPAEVSKIFKSPKNLKCQSSRDAVCYSNGTAMVVSCTNAAGSLVATLSVLLLASLAALAVSLLG